MAQVRLMDVITASPWMAGFKTVRCSSKDCARWLTQRHLDSRRVGVKMDESWYCCYACFAAAAEDRLMELMAAGGGTPTRNSRMPLGMILVSRGQMTYDQLRLATEEQKTSGNEIGSVFVRLGLATEEQVIKARAQQWGCPVFAPSKRGAPVRITVPPTLLRTHGMAPLHFANNSLLMGFASNIEYGALYAIEQMTGCKTRPCFVTESDFAAAMQVYETERANAGDSASEELAFEGVEGVTQMTAAICSYGRQINADQVTISRCRPHLWARLKSGERMRDILFRMD
jgi:hypothetical protein